MCTGGVDGAGLTVVDRRQAAAEAVFPLTGGLGALLVDGASSVTKDCVEASLPSFNIIVVNGTALCWGSWSSGGGGRSADRSLVFVRSSH